MALGALCHHAWVLGPSARGSKYPIFGAPKTIPLSYFCDQKAEILDTPCFVVGFFRGGSFCCGRGVLRTKHLRNKLWIHIAEDFFSVRVHVFSAMLFCTQAQGHKARGGLRGVVKCNVLHLLCGNQRWQQ